MLQLRSSYDDGKLKLVLVTAPLKYSSSTSLAIWWTERKQISRTTNQAINGDALKWLNDYNNIF